LWRRLDALPDNPATYRFPHRQRTDPTRATRMLWGRDPAGLQVELLRIDGGGHTPSSITDPQPWLLSKVLGRANEDVSTYEEMWTFFKDKRATAD
jgi:polyhydroxybutyrate depolymerase